MQTDSACSLCIYMTTWPRNQRYCHLVTGLVVHLHNSRNLASVPPYKCCTTFQRRLWFPPIYLLLKVIPKKTSSRSCLQWISVSPHGEPQQIPGDIYWSMTASKQYWRHQHQLWIIFERFLITPQRLKIMCTKYWIHNTQNRDIG